MGSVVCLYTPVSQSVLEMEGIYATGAIYFLDYILSHYPYVCSTNLCRTGCVVCRMVDACSNIWRMMIQGPVENRNRMTDPISWEWCIREVQKLNLTCRPAYLSQNLSIRKKRGKEVLM